MVEMEQIDDATYIVTDPRFTAQTQPLALGQALPGWVSIVAPLAALDVVLQAMVWLGSRPRAGRGY